MKSQEADFAFLYEGQVLTRFSLGPGEYVLGRAEECDIAIDMDGIREKHVRLHIGDRLVIEDLEDASETQTNGDAFVFSAELRAGAEVQLGSSGILRVERFTPLLGDEENKKPTEPLPQPAPTPAAPPVPAVSVAQKSEPSGNRALPAASPGNRKRSRKEKRKQHKRPQTDGPHSKATASPVTPSLPSTPPPQIPPAVSARSCESAPFPAEIPREKSAASASASVPAPLPQAPPAHKTTPAESPKSAELELEVQRLRLFLVDEIDRRRRAEKWLQGATQTPLPSVEVSAPYPVSFKRKAGKRRLAIAAAITLTGLSWATISHWVEGRDRDLREATLTVGSLRPAAAQFVITAEKLAENQDWPGAIQQLRYALTLSPERAAWRCRLADILLAEFRLNDALLAYRQAAADDPHLDNAFDGITVCERLLRAQDGSKTPSKSALYAIHRALMRHGRVAEAVKIAEQLPEDADLQQRTWQERLEKGGLDAEVQLDSSHRLTVRLRGQVQGRLELLTGMHAVAIWMPETDAHDLSPLAGLPLEELDLSRTMVTNIAALRDMPLRRLDLDRTQVEDLLPLRGSPIEELHLSRTPVRSLSSLRTMPLRVLDISFSRVVDLQPLATVPLKELDASSAPVSDIAPLAHLPLTTVRLDDTQVVDLSPLQGAPIKVLSLARTPITNIEALTQTPITVLSLSGCSQLHDLKPLAALKDLQKFILPNRTNTKEVQAILPQVRFIE